jgi:tyrosyl-tRNA synthetase
LDVIRDEYGQLQGSELNRVKVILADEATKLLHGEGSLEAIHQTVASLYASGSRSGTDNVESLAKIQLDKDDFVMNAGNRLSIPVYELLLKADMATSKSEARRLIKQGGAKVNDEKVVDELCDVTVESFDDQGKLKLSSGKKKHVIVLLPSTMT